MVNDRVIRESEGGEISFTLDAGAGNADRNYFLLGSLSGTEPGIPLPGGHVVLPLNRDFFTDLTYNYANTRFFRDFDGILDGSGLSSALLDTNGPLSGGYAGETLHFAYMLHPPYDFVSIPVGIRVVP